MSIKKRVLLIILDGWGIDQTWGGNAIGLAKTPHFDKLFDSFPRTTIEASGVAVGLPFGDPGNSEVGHLNIGSGKPVSQGLTAINKSIENGAFLSNANLKEAICYPNHHNGALHLIGLLSDGGIHSHINHLFALLELAKKQKQEKVYIHCITDGRDSPPTSSTKYIDQLLEKISKIGVGKIATISGRYYAMDRDNHWDRIERVYDAIVSGDGQRFSSPYKAISSSYADDITDEFILPAIIGEPKTISNNDSIIFFNYRSDRARQLTRSLVQKNFSDFKRKKVCTNLHMGTFGSYQENLPVTVIFDNKKVAEPLAALLTQSNLTHLHAAETEKYAHVTYFFNGGEEKPFRGEDRILVPSPAVSTYDLKPEMSADKITDKLLPRLQNFNFAVINYANADMVGHTGNLKAAISAVETVDKCIGRTLKKSIDEEFITIITADHGNADQMINPLTGLPDTEHTKNPVPFIFVSKHKGIQLKTNGRLCDIAPTILDLFDISSPSGLEGKSMLQ